MTTLWVRERGEKLGLRRAHLVVTYGSAVTAKVPLRTLDLVVLQGRVQMTPPALHALLYEGIETVILARGGRYLGRLSPPDGGNVALRRAQHLYFADPTQALTLAATIVRGKLRNMRTALRRAWRRRPRSPDDPASRALVAIRHLADRAPGAATLDEVRGLEGAATAAYLSALRPLFPAGFEFEARRRRPPPDPANALLSLTATLLSNLVTSAVQTVGLDVHAGVLHAERHGRPSLACDLVEEWRPVLAEPFVLSLIGLKQVVVTDFVTEKETVGDTSLRSVTLNDAAFRRVLDAWEARLDQVLRYEPLGIRVTWRQAVELQVRALARHLLGKAPVYKPFVLR